MLEHDVNVRKTVPSYWNWCHSSYKCPHYSAQSGIIRPKNHYKTDITSVLLIQSADRIGFHDRSTQKKREGGNETSDVKVNNKTKGVGFYCSGENRNERSQQAVCEKIRHGKIAFIMAVV